MKVEHRDDRVAREPSDEPASQRDDLLVLVVVAVERLEVVGAEIELGLDTGGGSVRQVEPHPGVARHEVPVGIVLAEEVHAEVARSELLLRMHDDGEELLLEREPVEARLDPLGSVAPAAHLLGLLVALVIVVELGVLQLVLVTLLHTGNRDAEVEVVHVDVPRDHAFHSHERQHVVHHIAVLG